MPARSFLKKIGYRVSSVPIGVKVAVVFLPLFVLLCGVGSIGFTNIHKLSEIAKEVAIHQIARIRLNNDAGSLLKDLHRFELLILANPSSQPYWEGRFKLADAELLQVIAELTTKIPDRSRDIQLFQAAYYRYITAHKSLLGALKNGRDGQAVVDAVHQSLIQIETASSLLTDLIIANNDVVADLARKTTAQTLEASRQITVWLVCGLLISVFEFVALLRFIIGITFPVRQLERAAADLAMGDLTRKLPEVRAEDEIGRLTRSFDTMVSAVTGLVREIVRAADELQVSSASLASASSDSGANAAKVALSIEEVARGAAKQVEDVTVSAERVSQISGAASQLALNVRLAADNAELLASAASEAKSALDQARQKMIQAERTVVDTVEVVRRLADLGKTIGSISDLIASFAKKTNFLALNAGVEAARAGEEGRGFAVLATEIRKLALESGQAARRIANMVENIHNETHDAIGAIDAGHQEVAVGVKALAHASHSLERIVTVVGEADQELRGIAAATRQVADSSTSIAESMDSVSAICENTAAEAQEVSKTAEQQNAAAEELAVAAKVLAHLAMDLKSLVRQFKVG